MKKLFFLILFFSINILTYGANVYFLNGGSGYIYTNGQPFEINQYGYASVSYWIWADPAKYTYDHCGASFQGPNGNWSSWSDLSNGQGLHTCSTTGTWHVKGRVHVVHDIYGYNDYWMYTSFTLYYYVVAPPQPLSVSISGPTSIALGPAGQSTWNATATGGNLPYQYQWWYKYPGGLPPLSINSTNDNTDIGIKSLKKSKTSKIDTVHEELLPGGGTWYQLSETSSSLTTYWYSNFYLKCLVTDANNTSVTSNILYVTVGGSGSQAAPLAQDDLAKIETKEKITEDKLLQNYPNPFNPTTQINYAVKEDGFVEIKVYDLLGKVVATLVNENKPAGFYSVSFDASRLSSGIYFYTIKTNNFFDRKKMIVLK